MKLFVTGGTGFIGSHFIEAALKDNHDVYALKRVGSKLRRSIERKPIWVEGELDSEHNKLLKQCDALVHLASFGVSPQPGTWQECIKVNVLQSMRLCEAAIASGIKNLLVIGTALEYGEVASRYKYIPADAPLEPSGPYASSKSAMFQLLNGLAKEQKVSLTYIRLFTVYGEGQCSKNFWPSLRSAAISGKDFKMTKGEQVGYFVYVKDVAQQLLSIIKLNNNKKLRVETHNFGSGKEQTLLEFAEYWWNKWEAKGKLIPGSVPYRKGTQMRMIPLIGISK
jgi:UDP-glucose 4-epimerase